MSQKLLKLAGVTVEFGSGKGGALRALDSVSLTIDAGETVGLVGESGSGKSVLAHTILGLLPRNASVLAGSVLWQGRDLLGLSPTELRQIRGAEIAMIFQDPQASLNPVYRVGQQLEWVLAIHRSMTGAAAKAEVLRLFEAVKLHQPDRCYRCYPHELSGGMCQRVMVAMAIACRPKLLIADEPTSSLDVTIQADILALLTDIRREFGMAMLFITHDLGVASHMCSRVVVLQRGIVVESGRTDEVFESPKASYTKRLMGSLFVPPIRTTQAMAVVAG